MCRLQNIAMCDYQESVTTRQIDRQTLDKVISMCRYASQATQKEIWLQHYTICYFISWDHSDWDQNKVKILRVFSFSCWKTVYESIGNGHSNWWCKSRTALTKSSTFAARNLWDGIELATQKTTMQNYLDGFLPFWSKAKTIPDILMTPLFLHYKLSSLFHYIYMVIQKGLQEKNPNQILDNIIYMLILLI